MPDELAEHLRALARDDCYRVDAVLKEGPYETTQRVFFVGANGAEQGPYVRKYLDAAVGLGAAYERIWKAQSSGRRFIHLPRVLECYTAGEKRAVVMEHVCGETLAEVLYRLDPSPELARDVFPKLCAAVRELHEGFAPPLIHRDLKPSNVMLTRENLTIIDFGIARSFKDGADEDTRRFGTRAYAPPEQFGFGQTDVRSDVYALGMLLYFCLTERTPDAKARREGFRDRLVPPTLRELIVRATAFDPCERYADAAELAEAFERALGPASAAPPSLAAPAAPGVSPQPDVSTKPAASGPSQAAGLAGAMGGPPQAAGLAGEALPAASPGGPRRRLAGFLARLRPSRGLGLAWDLVLLAGFIVFFAAATSLAINPKPDDELGGAPLALRLASYMGMILFVFGPVFYALSDRRPLRRALPALARLTLGRELAACALVLVVGFVLVGVAMQLARSG